MANLGGHGSERTPSKRVRRPSSESPGDKPSPADSVMSDRSGMDTSTVTSGAERFRMETKKRKELLATVDRFQTSVVGMTNWSSASKKVVSEALTSAKDAKSKVDEALKATTEATDQLTTVYDHLNQNVQAELSELALGVSQQLIAEINLMDCEIEEYNDTSDEAD